MTERTDCLALILPKQAGRIEQQQQCDEERMIVTSVGRLHEM
jgi:hypothetical protein